MLLTQYGKEGKTKVSATNTNFYSTFCSLDDLLSYRKQHFSRIKHP
jgi:hypothetical protein